MPSLANGISVKTVVRNVQFEGNKVIFYMVKKTEAAMKRVGGYLRNRARWSMRKRENKRSASPPGSPPHAHPPGYPMRSGKFGMQFDRGDPFYQSVVIGAASFGKYTGVLRLQEIGGTIPYVYRRGNTTVTPSTAGRLSRYPPRPYMGPALHYEIVTGNVARQWGTGLHTE